MTGIIFLIPMGVIVIAYILDMKLTPDSKGKEQQLQLPLEKIAAERGPGSSS
jgi:hypothetical protein